MAVSTVDEYLAGLPDVQRGTLQVLREQIRRAVSQATEVIAYGRPGYRLDGRYLVGFGATKTACSFYSGRAPVLALADELTSYRCWKGTVNFPPDRPLPAELVARLLAVRLAEFKPS
jgi:uncharacterized protein YdhG (YjbR/CyaY superfamily)